MIHMTMRNFHLPLPDRLYRSLRITAKYLRKPATQVARQALEQWLRERHASTLHEEIAAYARISAGTVNDLDKDLERAAVTHLLEREDQS